jgi:outer membrane protein assembly factor BamB
VNRPLTSSCFAIACVVVCSGADWLQFRGNNVDGIAANPSQSVSLDNVVWQAEMAGRGVSGPIVIGDRVVVTSSSGVRQDRLHVVCFSNETGTQLWERQFWATGRTMCHPKMSVATPTPASDGERIFAFYSSNDLACLDLNGNLLWYRGLTYDYPNASNSLGMASSPVVVGETLVVQVESEAESMALGLDVHTGLQRWKLERPRRANWTSPVLLRGDDGEAIVLLQSSRGLAAIDPQDGRVIWSYDDGASTIPSSVVHEQTVFVPSNGLTALRPIAASEAPEIRWQESRLSPGTSSPLVIEDRVFTLNKAGVLSCAKTETGELAWRLRLKGPFSASPVASGGAIYLINEEGVVQRVQPGEENGEVDQTLELKATILGTPAIAGDAVFVRSDGHLWKIAD